MSNQCLLFFEIFNSSLLDSGHLIIPPVLKLICQEDSRGFLITFYCSEQKWSKFCGHFIIKALEVNYAKQNVAILNQYALTSFQHRTVNLC